MRQSMQGISQSTITVEDRTVSCRKKWNRSAALGVLGVGTISEKKETYQKESRTTVWRLIGYSADRAVIIRRATPFSFWLLPLGLCVEAQIMRPIRVIKSSRAHASTYRRFAKDGAAKKDID